MVNDLLAAIAEHDGLEYKITEEKTSRIESYFVKKQLEMNRSVDVTHTFLTVYKTFTEDGVTFRGSSVTEIHPGMPRAQINEVIEEALYAAGFVKNEYYPLVDADSDGGAGVGADGGAVSGAIAGAECGAASGANAGADGGAVSGAIAGVDGEAVSGAIAGADGGTVSGVGADTDCEAEAGASALRGGGVDLYSALEKLTAAVYAEDRFDKGYLSYSEFFIARRDVRVLNSNGIDRSYTVYYTDMETAVNWREDSEIEITEGCAMADFDAKLLSERISKLFEVAAKKPLALMTPAVKDMNVLLTGECLKEFFSYYHSNSNAASVYNGISTFKTGDVLQGDVVSGDKISVRLDPALKGATKAKPYDSDGFPLRPVELITDGVLSQYWGDVRFSSYLGIPPTGDIGSYVVTGGTKSVAEMKAEPYLELISFSGFQMDPVTGDFASEIRLGFYFDGRETAPVTGGSVSGNIKNVHGDMYMSIEQAQYNNYKGPLTVCVRGVAIAGREV